MILNLWSSTDNISLIYFHHSRSKFKAGAENVKSSLQSISPQELLALLDSKDYIGSVVANDKYKGQVCSHYPLLYNTIVLWLYSQVFSDDQLNKLLDRSDLSWGVGKEEQKEPVKCETSVKGVFQVIDVDDKKHDLGSVRD